jgi:PAS domain S-box-containing protein
LNIQDSTKEELVGQLSRLRTRIAELEQQEASRAEDVQALQEKSNMLQSLLHCSPEPMVVYDGDGRVLFLNAAFTTTFGWSADELRGQRIDYVPEDCLAETRDTLERRFMGDHVPPFDTKRLTKAGRILDVHVSSALFTNSFGQPVGHIVTLRDVTERKRTEQALSKREVYLRSILNNAPFPMWLKDSDGRFLAVNDVFAESCGQESPEAVIGKTDLEVWPPELAERYRADDREVMNERRRKHVEEPVFDRGETKWFETFKTPIVNDHGDIMGTTGFARDVSYRKRMEEVLRESEEKYRSVFDNAAVGINLKSPDGTFLDVNRALANILGYDREELSRLSYLDITHPDDVQVSEEMHTAMKRGDIDTYRIEKRYIKKDRRVIWVDTSVSALRDSFGLLRATVGIITDITDRKNAEEALRESEERYRTLVSISPDGIFVNVRDEFAFANDAAARIFGVKSPGELIGKRPLDMIHPDYREAVRERTRSVLEERKPAPLYERKILRADGTVAYTENAAAPILFGGQPAAQVVIRDITERKKVEKALSDSEERYRLLAENSLTGVLIHQDGVHVYVNERLAEMTGYSVDELIGRDFLEIVHPDQRDEVRDRARKRYGGEPVPQVYEVRILHKSGDTRWGQILATMINYRGSDAIMGNMVDITDRKKDEEALRASEERFRVIAETISEVFWIADIQTATTFYVSPSYETIWGRSLASFYENPQSYVDAIHEDDRERVISTLDIKQDGQPFNLEYRIRRPDGDIRWIWDRGYPVPGDKGKPSRYVGIAQDITQQKKAEEALRESEENFRSFFEAMEDFIIVGTPAGKILYSNPATFRKLGYTNDELKKMHILDLHPSEFREEAERVFAEMFRGERQVCPLPLADKSGDLHPVETRVWFGKWSGFDCIFGICKDLSREQEALQKFDRLFQSNPALMAVSSIPERRFSDVNQAFLKTLGFSREEVIGKTSMELGLWVEPESQTVMTQRLEKFGKVSDIELKVKRKDGMILDGLFSGEIVESQGKASLLTVMIDITGRKQAEEKREQLLEELQTALAEVKKLSGFLPICASCKKIRDDKGYWQQIEQYISDHSEALFSHSLCPDCARKLYPNIFTGDSAPRKEDPH